MLLVDLLLASHATKREARREAGLTLVEHREQAPKVVQRKLQLAKSTAKKRELRLTLFYQARLIRAAKTAKPRRRSRKRDTATS